MSDEYRDNKDIDDNENVQGDTPEVPEGAPVPARPYSTDGTVARHRLQGMYQNWFLEYASYVILERAVPQIDDGLKPVQRRILHSMKTLDDGRFNKVATASDMRELSNHLRGMVNLLSSNGIKLDYADLAVDLYR